MDFFLINYILFKIRFWIYFYMYIVIEKIFYFYRVIRNDGVFECFLGCYGNGFIKNVIKGFF